MSPPDHNVNRFAAKLILFSLYAARLILCLLPQHGYIHPDEFFQFTEPVADRVLGTRSHLTWEFTQSRPIRSMFFPVIIAGSSFQILPHEPSPYLLLVVPRLVMTLLSFLTDWCLLQVMRNNDKSERAIFYGLFALSSSYVSLTYMTHTFSNCIEAILTSLLLVLVQKSLKRPSPYIFDCIGAILSLGLFNRPTFIAFAAVPVIWMLTDANKLSFKRVTDSIVPLMRSFVVVTAVLIAWDTNYYSDVLVDFYNMAYSNYWETAVITPLNFVLYNSQTDNLSRHGLHPRCLHLFNLFLLVNILVIPLFFTVWRCFGSLVRKKKFNSNQQQELWLTGTIVVSICLLMVFPHQEPRFLLPLVVIVCALVGDNLSKKHYLIPWIFFNILFTLFYAFVHQSGVTQSLFTFNKLIASGELDVKNNSIVFTNMYLPPQHLMHAPKHLDVHDLSVAKYPDELIETMTRLRHQNGTVYVAAPACIEDSILSTALHLKYKDPVIHEQYFPHFTGEDFVNSWDILLTSGNVRKAFGFNIWKMISS